MDAQTLELLRALQGAGRDADALAQIRALLREQRPKLTAAGDLATLADVSELLEVWAEGAEPALASIAAGDAAVIARDDLGQPDRAAQLLAFAVELDPTQREALEGLEAVLRQRGEYNRLEQTLKAQAKALREHSEIDPAPAAEAYRSLGKLCLELGSHDRAIAAYEEALELSAEPEIIEELAGLYALRGRAEDREQAADLYYTLGDALGNPDGLPLLELALDQHPGHEEALDLLESYVPISEQASRLQARWSAYIEAAGETASADGRRMLLARVHAAEGRYRDALLCIAPLVERGDASAQRLQEAFLSNLEGAAGKSRTAPSQPRTPPSRALKPRSGVTVVGFRVPADSAKSPPAVALAVDAQSDSDAVTALAPTPVPMVDEDRDSAIRPRAAEPAEALPEPPAPKPTTRLSSRPPATKPAAPPLSRRPARNAAAEVRARANGKSAGANGAGRAGVVSSAPRPAAAPVATPLPQPASAGPATLPKPFSVPPPLATTLQGPLPELSHAALPALATTLSGPVPALTPPASAPESAPQPVRSAATLLGMHGGAAQASQPRSALAASAAPVAASPTFPSVPSVSPSLAPVSVPALPSVGAASVRDRFAGLDRRWLVAIGGTAAALVLAGALVWGGGSESPPSAASSETAPSETPEPAAAEATASAASAAAAEPSAAAEPAAAPAPPAEPVEPVAEPQASAEPGADDDKAQDKARKPRGFDVQLLMGKLRTSGGKLDKKAVQSSLRGAVPQLERCYGRALKQRPKLEGRAVYALTVNRRGAVSGVRKVSSNVRDKKLIRCSTAALKRTRFDKPKGKSAKVRIPVAYKQ